jgi:hypothetical protein
MRDDLRPHLVPDASAHTALPRLIKRYLDRVLPPDARAASQVLITQTGEMSNKPGARPMRFTAVEHFAVHRVAFSWEARFVIARLLSFHVVDRYDNGRGALTVRALRFPVQTEAGPDIALGEAYRYLAELPWVPHAMAANRELVWSEVDERSVEVSTAVGGKRPTVRLEFDDAGDIVRCAADRRPGTVGGRAVSARWGGNLGGYETLGGIRMPSQGEVYWELPEGRFTYWRGEVTSARALPEP